MLYSINPIKTFTAGVSQTLNVDHESYLLPTVSIKPTLTMSTYTPATASAHLALKKITLSGSLNNRTAINVALPKIALAGSLYVPGYAATAIALPKMLISGTIAAPMVDYSLAVTLRKMILAGSVSPKAVAGLDIALKKIVLQGAIAEPRVYSTAVRIPKITVSAAYSVLPSYAAALLLKKMAVNGALSAEAVAALVSTWLVNLNTKGHWMYDGFEFNSVVRYRDEYYLANDTGLFKLQTPAIPTVVGKIVTPTLALADQNAVYIHDAYLHCRGNNELTFSTITDEDRRVDYDVSVREEKEGKHVKHIRLAKGVRGNNWSFELQNVRGGRLDMSVIDIRPLKSKRSS